MKYIKNAVYISLFFFFVILPVTCSMITSNAISSATAGKQESSGKITKASEPDKPETWSYHEEEDTMKTGKTKMAVLSSNNQVDLKFPYHGQQKAELMIRKSPRFGEDIIFRIERGQIICHDSELSYGQCDIPVKFDDGNPQAVRFSVSADHDSTYIFISNYDKVIAKIKKSKTMYISPTLYQEGSPTFVFNTANLVF